MFSSLVMWWYAGCLWFNNWVHEGSANAEELDEAESPPSLLESASSPSVTLQVKSLKITCNVLEFLSQLFTEHESWLLRLRQGIDEVVRGRGWCQQRAR